MQKVSIRMISRICTKCFRRGNGNYCAWGCGPMIDGPEVQPLNSYKDLQEEWAFIERMKAQGISPQVEQPKVIQVRQITLFGTNFLREG